MPTVTQSLADILQTVTRPGDFYARGTQDVFLPGLEVADVGPISLPLLPAQAERLIAVAEQAPYGRGAETLVDTAVRKTWQIAADRVHLGGRHWASDLARIVERSAVGLGVLEPVTAELYKMLVYDAGSFFVSHRDTEKAPGMFATLIVVLPSIFTGGELRIRHREREVCLDLASADPAELAFAAFYADCLHEVRPIISGCRLVLVYNLIRPAGGELPRPPAYEAEVDRVVLLLKRWAARPSAADGAAGGAGDPRKLIYPLEHVYSSAEMRFSTLKLADAVAAAVLVAAAERADCRLHLAFLTIDENGAAEYADFSRSGRGRYHAEDDDYEDDYGDDLEAGEVFERILTLSDWRCVEGGPSLIDILPGDDAEICPPQALADAEPDEEEFSEATGNAGASFERRYRRAALVIWPRAGETDLIAAAGRAASLPYLDRLTRRCAAEASETRASLLDQAHALARLMIDRRDDWPVNPWRWAAKISQGDEMLTALCRIGDTDNIATFIAEISAAGGYGDGDNPALCEALMHLPPAQAADLATRVIAGNAIQQAAACAGLLNRLATAFVERLPVGEAAERLRPAVQALLAALPGEAGLSTTFGEAGPAAPGGVGPAAISGGQPVCPVTPALLVDLLQALYRLANLALGEQAVELVLARPGYFPFDAILIPAALSLADAGDSARPWPPARRLDSACLAHLAQRIAEPLVPPADFVRENRIDCGCAHCRELAVFLTDPRRREWIFKAAQTHREHVQGSIRRQQCDVDCQTLRHGRPHSLVCRKNQASFERRVAQRKHDLAARERLSQAAGE